MQTSAYFSRIVGRFEAELTDSIQVAPREFLEWAEKDLSAGDKRGRGNALGNIKKSLHSRIDQIIGKTHVRFTKDWNPKQASTEQKLDVLRQLGIHHDGIVDILTSVRNEYEHAYVLPSARVLKAHLHAAQLWIEMSYSSYEFFSVGLADLPLRKVCLGSKQSNGSTISIAEFGDPQRVVCFIPEKKCLLTIHPDGREEPVEFRSFDVKSLLRIEAPLIQDGLAGACKLAVGEADIAELISRYSNWLKARRAGGNQKPSP